ncbi:MAG: D-amino acid dehydrogenase 1 [Anaerolineales bacterium]|nr:D-amino acid dehydrogenase 1 [Anaerolineales bacterium]
MNNPPDILILGGGVIGVCAAHYLCEEGASVTIIEKGEIACGSSFANAGLIVPSHSIPLAEPGALAAGLKWMLDPASPFYIQPRLAADLWAWVARFIVAAREPQMRRAIPLLRDLHTASASLYQGLAARRGLDFDYEQKGMLTAYASMRGLRHAEVEAKLLAEFGVRADLLDAAETRRREPALRDHIAGGVFFPNDGHFNPAKFVQGLANQIEERGARIQRNTEVLRIETRGNRIQSVLTTSGTFYGKQIVLAAGAWTPRVARDLGINIPVQAAKGYSLTVPRPDDGPSLPLILGEARVAVTPMGGLLRFAGTLEMAGMDLSVNPRRVAAIAHAAASYLKVDKPAATEVWRGLRPCTPDGLPILGRARRYENLIIATGHAMGGMSLGPISGKLVMQIALGQPTEFDLSALRVERF